MADKKIIDPVCQCKDCEHSWQWFRGNGELTKVTKEMLQSLVCPECNSWNIELTVKRMDS